MDRFEHLSDAQLEQFGTAATGSSGQATSSPGNVAGSSGDAVGPSGNAVGPLTDAEIERHLEDCPECRTRLLQHQQLHFAPLADHSVKTEPSPGCPSNETLQNLAAGLPVSPADPAQLVQHAAECDHCGPLLREYTEIFSDDLTPADDALLAQLKTSSPEWHSATVAKMQAAAGVKAQTATTAATTQQPAAVKDGKSAAASSSTTGSKLFLFPSFKWVMMPAAAAACAVIAFSVWWTQRDTPEKAEKLLAQAYTEQRTMEMRWPGADFSPVRVSRGSAVSEFSKPAALLKSEAILVNNEHRTDPDWLQARAELEILNWHPETAITLLNKASMKKTASQSVLSYLALAWLQKAELSNDSVDYVRALERLDAVLRLHPSDRTALFNRAVALKHLGRMREVVEACEKLKTIEGDQRWARECESQFTGNPEP